MKAECSMSGAAPGALLSSWPKAERGTGWPASISPPRTSRSHGRARVPLASVSRSAMPAACPTPTAVSRPPWRSLSLNFVPDAAQAAREMRRVVRPGGVVAAAVWDFRGGLVFQRLFWDTAAGLDPGAGAARDRLFSSPLALPDGLPVLWDDAGLAAVERGSITIRMEYADFADYWEPLLGGQGPVGAYVEGLSPERRPLIEERVRAAFLSGAPDGPRSLTATAWAVRGIVP